MSLLAEQAILSAAVSILTDAGYSDLSIDAVADRAGAHRGAVYRRWPSKLELVIDAVMRRATPLSDVRASDTRIELRQLVVRLMADMTGLPIGRAVIALADDTPGAAELARRLHEHYLTPGRAIITGLLGRAVTAGTMHSDINLDLTVDLILAAATCRWLTTTDPVNAEASRRIVDTVWAMLQIPASPSVIMAAGTGSFAETSAVNSGFLATSTTAIGGQHIYSVQDVQTDPTTNSWTSYLYNYTTGTWDIYYTSAKGACIC